MSIPTVALNEASPAGGHYIRDGNDRIMEYKTQNREILEVDHVYPSSGQSADAGKHKQVTLTELADIGTGAAGYAALGAQTCDGKPELVYTDEDDDDVQITKDGLINHTAIQNASDELKAVLVDLFFPIGFIYITTVSTNPGTYLGGTWAAFGAGRVLVGLDATDTDFDTSEETGGSKTNSHTHNVTYTNAMVSGTVTAKYVHFRDTSGSDATSAPSDESIVQPYIVVYMFKRTA